MAEVAAQGQKRTLEEAQDSIEGVKVILLDIEGTSAPISFVKDKMFPYVRKNLKLYLETHWETEELQADIDALREQVLKDKEAKIENVPEIPSKANSKETCCDVEMTEDNKTEEKEATNGESNENETKEVANKDVLNAVVNNVIWQMDQDRKTAGLKQLQAHIWRDGFKTKKLVGDVYKDAVEAIKTWNSSGKKVCIYSSGSVEAQKMLFGHTETGDLTEFLSGYFDLKTGPKDDKNSYLKIAEECGVKPEEVLFLTDVPKEAKAAVEAGMKTNIVIREGNAPLTDEDKTTFNTIFSFSELLN